MKKFATVALLLVVMAGASAIVWAQAKPGSPRAFDYWQPEWMMRELWGPGRMSKSMMVRLLRHSTYMQYGVPEAYADAKSTLEATPEAVAVGAKLYGAQCAACHGRDGMGDGDAGNALSPSPALLAWMIRRPVSVDEYLLWAISDGGAQFDSAMPAFKDRLSRDDVWHVIAYMRAGFPEAAPATKR
jgi:mono/diheme cytochrome c family protein